MQEYDPKAKKLTGESKNIFQGSGLGATEAPHLYKHNDYYYLMVAEGGTGYGHAVTMARSKNIDGPYEIDPGNPMLTSVGNPNPNLEKSGHASLIELENGDCYLAHLCGRPVKDTKQCI